MERMQGIYVSLSDMKWHSHDWPSSLDIYTSRILVWGHRSEKNMSISFGIVIFLNTDLTNESEHVACDIPLRKSSTSICEKVLPFPLESSIIRSITECGIVFCHQILGKVGI